MSIYKNEDKLQEAFITWFTQMEGYDEKFNDCRSEKGTSMDSAGFINEQPVLIEFKLKIGSRESTEIERKVNAVLLALHGAKSRHNQKITKELSTWNQMSVPHIIIVAHTISRNAKDALKEILSRRAQQWQFNCTLWEWANEHEHEKVLHLKQFDNYEHAGAFPPISAMPPIPSAKRSPLQLEEFSEIAERNGVGKLFEVMLVRAKQLHGTPKVGTSVLSFVFPERGPTPLRRVANMWPGKSSTITGLLIGYKLSLLPDSADETSLPGVPQEPKEGWLDKSRWLRTVEEVNLFWDIVANENGNR